MKRRQRVTFDVQVLQFQFLGTSKKKLPFGIMLKWKRGKTDSGASKCIRMSDHGLYSMDMRFSFTSTMIVKSSDLKDKAPRYRPKILSFKIYEIESDTYREGGVIGKASLDVSKILYANDGNVTRHLRVKKKKNGLLRIPLGNASPDEHMLTVNVSVNKTTPEDDSRALTSDSFTENENTATFDSPTKVPPINLDTIQVQSIESNPNSLPAQEEDISEFTSKDNASFRQTELYSRGVQAGSRMEYERLEDQIKSLESQLNQLKEQHEKEGQQFQIKSVKMKTKLSDISNQLKIQEEHSTDLKNQLQESGFKARTLQNKIDTLIQQHQQYLHERSHLLNDLKSYKGKLDFIFKEKSLLDRKYAKRKIQILEMQKSNQDLHVELETMQQEEKKKAKRLEKKNIVLASLIWGAITAILYVISMPFYRDQVELEVLARKVVAVFVIFSFLVYSSMKIGKKFRLKGSGLVTFIERPEKMGKDKMRLKLKQSILFGLLIGGLVVFIQYLGRVLLQRYGYVTFKPSPHLWKALLYSLFESVAETLIGRMFFFIMTLEMIVVVIQKCEALRKPNFIQRILIKVCKNMCPFKNKEKRISHNLQDTQIIRVGILVSSLLLGIVKLQFLATNMAPISSVEQAFHFLLIVLTNWLNSNLFVIHSQIELTMVSHGIVCIIRHVLLRG